MSGLNAQATYVMMGCMVRTILYRFASGLGDTGMSRHTLFLSVA